MITNLHIETFAGFLVIFRPINMEDVGKMISFVFIVCSEALISMLLLGALLYFLTGNSVMTTMNRRGLFWGANDVR